MANEITNQYVACSPRALHSAPSGFLCQCIYALAIINNHGRAVFFTVARFSADNNNFFYYKIGLQNILFAPTICIKTIIKKELHLTILNKLLNL